MSNENRKTSRPKHGPVGGMPTEKAKDFKGSLISLIKSMSSYHILLIAAFAFAIGSTIFSIVGPKILGNATTELSNGLINKITGVGGIDFQAIGSILLTVLIIYIVSAIFSYIEGLIMTQVSQKYTYQLRKKISEKLNRLPVSYFDKKTHGEVLSIITNDVDTLSMCLNQSATEVITSIVTIIGILVMMISINIPMTIVAILILPVSIFLISFVMKHIQHFFKEQQEYLASVNGKVEEMFGSHTVVKVFNAEEKVLNDFRKENDKLCKSAMKSQFFSGLMHPIMTFVGNIGYVLVAIIGGAFAIQGKITIGNIQSFISYAKNFTQPIMNFAQVSNMLQSMLAAAERIFEFLDEEEEAIVVDNPVKLTHVDGAVEFQNVHFGYNPEQIIINDFNASVKPGQKIAIVGPTGAGKTTMVKLLMRFYKVNSGAILVDGHNINDFNREDLRGIFGMVLQDTWLFSGTVMENLRYGKLDATDDEVIAAAKTAYVHHFIQTLPDGYQMQLNEETSNISGGQKQLLTIARAILADPKILILDEATSSVDTRTEILIQKAMDKLLEGRTSFIIAHRLSTVKNADLILVMDKGDIVEQGTHEELLAKNGFYANLYNSQFEHVS